jgi:hypothetical protein
VSEELGSEVISHIEVEATPVRDEAVMEGLTNDPTAGLASEPGRVETSKTVIVARLSAEAEVRRGTPLSLLFDASKMHFFDLDDGKTLRTQPALPAASGAQVE